MKTFRTPNRHPIRAPTLCHCASVVRCVDGGEYENGRGRVCECEYSAERMSASSVAVKSTGLSAGSGLGITRADTQDVSE